MDRRDGKAIKIEISKPTWAKILKRTVASPKVKKLKVKRLKKRGAAVQSPTSSKIVHCSSEVRDENLDILSASQIPFTKPEDWDVGSSSEVQSVSQIACNTLDATVNNTEESFDDIFEKLSVDQLPFTKSNDWDYLDSLCDADTLKNLVKTFHEQKIGKRHLEEWRKRVNEMYSKKCSYQILDLAEEVENLLLESKHEMINEKPRDVKVGIGTFGEGYIEVVRSSLEAYGLLNKALTTEKLEEYQKEMKDGRTFHLKQGGQNFVEFMVKELLADKLGRLRYVVDTFHKMDIGKRNLETWRMDVNKAYEENSINEEIRALAYEVKKLLLESERKMRDEKLGLIANALGKGYIQVMGSSLVASGAFEKPLTMEELKEIEKEIQEGETFLLYEEGQKFLAFIVKELLISLGHSNRLRSLLDTFHREEEGKQLLERWKNDVNVAYRKKSIGMDINNLAEEVEKTLREPESKMRDKKLRLITSAMGTDLVGQELFPVGKGYIVVMQSSFEANGCFEKPLTIQELRNFKKKFQEDKAFQNLEEEGQKFMVFILEKLLTFRLTPIRKRSKKTLE